MDLDSVDNLAVDQCKYFAEYFVKHFEEKRDAYYNETMGITSKSSQPLKFLEPAGAGFRGGAAAGAGIGRAAGVAWGTTLGAGLGIAAAATTTLEKIGTFVSNYKHKTKAEKISEILCQGEDKKKVRETLVNVSIQIYRSYEDALIKLTKYKNWRITLRKLARDAVDRVMDYIYIYKKDNPEENIQVDQEFLLEAFLKGKSKGFICNKISKHKVPLVRKEWTFSHLNDKVGIAQNVNAKYLYYKRRSKKSYVRKKLFNKNNQTDYGFRIVAGATDLNKDYKQIEDGFIQPQLLQSLTNTIAEEVTNKLDKDDSNRKSERLENNQKDIKEHIKIVSEKIDVLLEEKLSLDKFPMRFNFIEPVKHFVGRKSQLEDIFAQLENNNNDDLEVSRSVCIVGTAGAGKSELARKFAVKYKDCYQGLVWINSENVQSLKNCFQNLAKKLNIHTIEKTERNEKEQARNIMYVVEEVYKKFVDVDCLFIFDNAEEYGSIKEFLPSSRHFYKKRPHLLITSRNIDWDIGQAGHIGLVPIDVFTPEEAEEFIRKSLNINENDKKYDSDIKDLAGKLQNLPIALEQAVSYIEEKSKLSRCSGLKKFDIQDYLNKFKEKSQELLNFRKDVSDRYINTLYSTWKVTMDKIKKTEIGKSSLKILEMISYFSPDCINLKKCFHKSSHEDGFWESIEQLRQYSIVKVENGEVSIHRLIQEVIRLHLQSRGKEEEVLRKVVKLVLDWEGTNEYHAASILTFASKYGEIIDHFYTEYNFEILTQALHLYAKYGCNCDQYDAVALLLDKGADLLAFDNQMHTAVHKASENGNLCLLKLFIDRGASITTKDNDNWTPLHSATFNGNKDVVNFLIKNGAEVNLPDLEGWTPLHNAASNGFADVVKILIINGANVNQTDKVGWTPLHGASSNGHLEVVNILIKKGADVTLSDNFGRTPLHRAALHAHLEVVKVLVENGADVKSANKSNWTVLHNSTQSGNFGVVKFVVENGADVHCLDKYGWSPLRTAAKFGFKEITKYLIEKGTSVNVVDKYGCTPIHTCSRNGNVEMVKLLIEANANVNHEDNDGWTPLHNASQRGHLGIVESLIENGAEVNSADKNGFTPLHSAARTGHLEVASLLISKGADIMVKNDEDKTAVDLAIANGHTDLEEYLLHEQFTS